MKDTPYLSQRVFIWSRSGLGRASNHFCAIATSPSMQEADTMIRIMRMFVGAFDRTLPAIILASSKSERS